MEFEKLQGIIAEVLNVEADSITTETTFVEDLGADSLDIFQIFDKYRFFGSVGPLFQLLVQAAGLCQEIVDQVLLADVEGDHPHAVPGQLRIMAAAL